MKTIYDLEFRIYTIHANKYNYLLPSAIRIILYFTNYIDILLSVIIYYRVLLCEAQWSSRFSNEPNRFSPVLAIKYSLRAISSSKVICAS